MPGPSVLLVDPDEPSRHLIEKTLKKRFSVTVTSVAQTELALVLCRRRNPSVVLAGALQNKHDGFRLCGALRQLLGSRPCTMVVYGTGSSSLDHRSLAAEYELNTWLPTADPKMIARVLESKLPPAALPDDKRPAQRDFSMKYERFSATLDGVEPGARIEDDTPLHERDWPALLRSNASVAALRTAMTKSIHIGGKPRDIHEVESPHGLSWGELLRSEIKPATLKFLLTKEVLSRKEEKPRVSLDDSDSGDDG